MNADKTVAFVVPTSQEFAPYRSLLSDLRRVDGTGPWEIYEALQGGRRLLFAVSGAGPVNAAAATERLIAVYGAALVLNGGSAGAHNPDLMPGDVIVGSRYVVHLSRPAQQAREARGLHPSLIRYRRGGHSVNAAHIDADPRLLAFAEKAAQTLAAEMGNWSGPGWPDALPRRPARVVSGVIASADAWTVDPDELRMLREDFGAECEDMESAYVAQVAAMHALPFLAVRVVSNNEAAKELAPDEVGPAIGEAGARAALVLLEVAAES